MAEKGIPIIGPILNRIIGTRNERFVKRYTRNVQAIGALEPRMRTLTDGELRAKVGEFRARFDKREDLESIMIDAFAAAREAMDRSVGIRCVFDPARNFDPSALKPAMRDLYATLRAEMDARPPLAPEGEWAGHTQPIPGWRQGEVPPEFYEAVRELIPESRPPFRARPFDVQLIGGMVLSGGKISEMKTGEGKTIVAPLACYLGCIQRMKVHVVTVNDYLVQRDRDWTAPYFHALGLTVGAIHPMHMQDEEQKRVMYRCDVVYGTTAEFGFDYLRDNMKRSVESQVQRKREFAVVDEVDSILIDEARTPLIISGPAHSDQPRYELADRLARHLVDKQRPWAEGEEKVDACRKRIKGLEGDVRQARDKARVPALQAEIKSLKAELPKLEAERNRHTQYFEVLPERKSAHLTHEGISEAQRAANVGSFYVDQNMDLPHLLEQAVRAHAVYQRDRDYVVMTIPDPQTGRPTPSVVIVDVFTGRPMIGRQWSDGLHQAVECKEKVPIKQETQTVATITIQNFFKMYKRLAGMTGTADTEAQEFHDIYKLDVVGIPTNRPVVRRDFNDMVFLVQKDKWGAIVDEIKAFHDVGRPILVGTTSVEKSELLAKMLMQKHGIQHEVLNAKQHEREAHIVENAGQLGAVMIATNMAGRGTDIKLAPLSRGALLEHWLRRGIAPRTLTVEAGDEQLREAVYRKIAPQELELKKKEAEEMPAPELELALLRHWARRGTWLTDAQIEKADAEALRAELDAQGRCLLHRLRWFATIEEMGGLHVIGTERHEARRIDNQLRGRSGRQGDRGSSRFFAALDDDLMKMFAGDTTMRILSKLGMKEGDAIEHPMLSKSIEKAQRKVEERNFQIRKNVLEYDEVMEHQRQAFYGLRQRVLEGRDVKGLLFEYISRAVSDACAEYLDEHYAARSAAEYAKEKLEAPISWERLRGKDRAEMELAITAEAKSDTRAMIEVTLGEYMPMEGSEVVVDFDRQGLADWARARFGVEIDQGDLKEPGPEERRRVLDTLYEAAERRIEEADLSGLDAFLAPDYGAGRLADWVQQKFAMEIARDAIAKAHRAQEQGADEGARELIMGEVKALYRKREVEYPVDFAMDMTQMLMRQSPAEAAANLAGWARQRFGMDWTPETVMKTVPGKIREQLLAASAKFVEEQRIEKEVAEAQKKGTDAELEAHFRERFGAALPENMRYLTGQERTDAIRSRVENILRAELLYFERTLFLDVLDGQWKDHLYAMDQLRDSISFRAFSQQDPRIEYKREGSKLFKEMMDNVRGRITDVVFKARVTPQAPQAARPAMAPAMPRAVQRVLTTARPAGAPAVTPVAPPAARGPARSSIVGPSIVGPGMGGLGAAFAGPAMSPGAGPGSGASAGTELPPAAPPTPTPPAPGPDGGDPTDPAR